MLNCLFQLTVEAQLRFKRTIDEVMDILCKVREIISEMCNHQMDYRDIDNYLRGNHAKSSLITSVSHLVLKTWRNHFVLTFSFQKKELSCVPSVSPLTALMFIG